jgi:hypothetical protein
VNLDLFSIRSRFEIFHSKIKSCGRRFPLPIILRKDLNENEIKNSGSFSSTQNDLYEKLEVCFILLMNFDIFQKKKSINSKLNALIFRFESII